METKFDFIRPITFPLWAARLSSFWEVTYMFCLQAKESWEMNTVEKLEQSGIVKEKGTQYFKVQYTGEFVF